ARRDETDAPAPRETNARRNHWRMVVIAAMSEPAAWAVVLQRRKKAVRNDLRPLKSVFAAEVDWRAVGGSGRKLFPPQPVWRPFIQSGRTAGSGHYRVAHLAFRRDAEIHNDKPRIRGNAEQRVPLAKTGRGRLFLWPRRGLMHGLHELGSAGLIRPHRR